MNDEKTIKVWDICVRTFHWTLVTCFVIAYVTHEDINLWHIYSGYVILALLTFRLVWGFIGSKYARFSDFIYPASEVSQYLKGLRSKNPKHYLGHNPAGGWMILALLLCLFIATISGLKVYATEDGKGPLALNTVELDIINKSYAHSDEHKKDNDNANETQLETEDSNVKEILQQTENTTLEEDHSDHDNHKHNSEFWVETHELSANLALLLILLHIIGVVVSSKLHKENLVKAMITGKKKSQ